MLRSLLVSLLTTFLAVPAFSSLHVWLGTASNRTSDAANWSGGSPAGDPDADLFFDPLAVRPDVFNDIPNLRFRTLTFRNSGTLFGEPLVTHDGTISDAKIYCDITVEGTLTITGSSEFHGAISGAGGVRLENSTAMFTGPKSNTYAGDTTLHESTLILNKSGAVALPGTVRTERGSVTSRVRSLAGNQFAPTAVVVAGTDNPGELEIDGDETIHALHLTKDVATAAAFGQPGPTLTTDLLDVQGHIQVRPNLRLTQDVLELPAPNSLDVERAVSVPAGGLTLHGGGRVSWSGNYTAPVHIDGTTAALNTPNSPVDVLAGAFSGHVASLSATGGMLTNGIISAGDMRLGTGATVSVYPAFENTHAPIEVNGTLDLGNATLDVKPLFSQTTTPVIIIRNASSQPVTGTFKGIPEGGVSQNRWIVSYHGGDGNDVTVTDLMKPDVTFHYLQEPTPGFFGEPVTFTVTLTGSGPIPTGTITFRTDTGALLGTVPLVDGKASIQRTAANPNEFAIYPRYSGDATYGSSGEQGVSLTLAYRKPVITSIDPATIPAGAKTDVTIRGSYFMQGDSVIAPGGGIITTNVISPTEIRATFDTSRFRTAATVQVKVQVPVGSLTSDPKPLTITEAPQPASTITIDGTTVSAKVTAHAKTAWITSSSPASKFVVDDDGDGVVSWQSSSFGMVYAVVDLTSGNYSLRGSGNAAADARPFPAHSFVKDASGNVSMLVLRLLPDQQAGWNFLWARAGVGAWRAAINDGEDLDGTRNNIMVMSVASMLPLGDSPAHPAGFAAGDVLIAIPSGRDVLVPLFAAHLGGELNDTAPGAIQLLASSTSVSEQDPAAHITLLRTDGASGTATVHYRTIDRYGTAGIRYVPSSGVVTFAPGEVLKTFDVPLLDDTIFDGADGFDVALFDPSAATLGERTESVVLIRDDDAPPGVDFAGEAQRRVVTGAAPATAQIALTLTGATLLPARVQWKATSDGTVTQSGVVVFAPGERSKNVEIAIPGGPSAHVPRQILVDFLGDASVTVQRRFLTINVSNGLLPRVNVSDASIGEKGGTVHVTVTLSAPPLSNVSFDWATADDTAKSGSDYALSAGILEFSPTQTQQVIDVPIKDDADVEGDETFTINLKNEGYPSDVLFFPKSSVSVVIVDDETTSRPRLSIVDHATVREGNEPAAALLDVHLSEPSAKSVRVRYVTSGITAQAGIDFEATDSVLTFAPGETAKTISIPVFGDTVIESDETFAVTLSPAENATLDNATSIVTIVNDDTVSPHRHATR